MKKRFVLLVLLALSAALAHSAPSENWFRIGAALATPGRDIRGFGDLTAMITDENMVPYFEAEGLFGNLGLTWGLGVFSATADPGLANELGLRVHFLGSASPLDPFILYSVGLGSILDRGYLFLYQNLGAGIAIRFGNAYLALRAEDAFMNTPLDGAPRGANPLAAFRYVLSAGAAIAPRPRAAP